jgi:hypothetical protein
VNLRTLVLKFAAVAALCAAAAMCVVSAGYALFAAVTPEIGAPWAAAVVALAAAIVTLVGSLLLFRKGDQRRELKGRAAGWADRLVETARERPLAVAALAVAAGWILVRNPALAHLASAALSERRHRRR